MTSPQLFFMIYDSRSGSTLLARKLAEELKDVAVTPEIGFDSLLRREENEFSQSMALAVVQELYRSGDFRNIGVEQGDMVAAVRQLAKPITAAGLIQCFIQMWLRATGKQAAHVVVKNGTHAKYWRSIKRIWPDTARIIFVFRDPRAVVNSKLRTVRPYHSHEVMAWGGPLLAAWRWKTYSLQMRHAASVGVRVLDVKYETLLASPDAELEKLAAFIGTDRVEGKTVGEYEIPAAEQKIHTLVTSGEIRKERGEAWMHELSAFDRGVIESACRSEMEDRGYELSRGNSRGMAVCYLLAALPGMTIKVGRHYLFRFLRHG